jgi:integral membrane protein (TIGR00529 family)
LLSVVGVLVAYAVIVSLRIKNIDFTFSILAGSMIIIITSVSPTDVLLTAIQRTTVALISALGYCLKETSLMTELIDGLREILPSRVLLAIIPAMFGLLTMPGGALMSAPFNEPEAKRLGLRPEQKTYLNVWFRHLWYWASPLSPVTILGAGLSGFPLNNFLRAQLPIFAVTLFIGFIIGGSFITDSSSRAEIPNGLYEVVKGLFPIALAIVLTAIGIPIWLALIIGLSVAFIIKNVPPIRALKMIQSGIRWDLTTAVISMLFFRFVVIASGSVNALFETATKIGIPLMAILLIVPILVGSISGTPTMGIGIILPLLLPLLGEYTIFGASIIYAGVIAGYLASPMHLCLILTNSYYKSELGKVYRYLIPSSIALYSIATIYYIFMNGGFPV